MKKQDFKVLKTKDLYPFPDNPFHVAEDETLSELAESIKEFGIVTPIITRPKEDGDGYEVIAGQRRVRASELAGITDDPKAIEVIAELIDKLPDIEVRGSLEKWQAAILATEIDQFSYDYDTYQYQDTVEDREAQVANITEDIRNGNTGYLNDFLNAVISEGVREGITDIFGQGVEIDDSEAVQTARRAKELLDKLAEYKPLAKIEELEEQNYNMIDNVLNNGAEKKEQEQTKGRISIKEKLAEKKAVIEQRDKAERTSPEKETEKKSQREM